MITKLTLMPLGQTIEVDSEAPLYQQIKAQNIDINGTCGGCASCGKCIVKVIKGEEFLSEVELAERQLLGNVFHMTKERLACQLRISGEVAIDITEHLPKEKQGPVLRRTKVDLLKKAQEAQLNKSEEEKPVKPGGLRRPKAFQFEKDEE